MPRTHSWTQQADAALLAMRGGGACWEAIAATLGVSLNAVMERGRRVGARLPARVAAARLPPDLRDRPALPPGHPTAWAVLTEGTLLEGSPWSPPPPMGRRHAGAVGEVC